MKNLFEDITTLEDHIKDLNYKLKFSKNQKKDKDTLNRLSTVLLNYNDVLHHKYRLDSLNTVILYWIRERIKADGILYPSREWLAMTSKQIGQHFKDGYPTALTELTDAIYLKYETTYQTNGEPLSFVIPKSEIEEKIMEMIGNIKQDIQWTPTQ